MTAILPSSSSELIQWRPERQQLEIDWSPVLGYPCRFFISSWENGITWWSYSDGDIHRPTPFEEPGIDLLSPSANPVIQQWQATLPENILHSIRQFNGHGFSLLKLVHDWPEASDLMHSNPVLFWMCWDYALKQGIPFPELRTLLSSRQTDILSGMELTGTKSALRLLRKYQTTDFDLYESMLVRRIWGQPDLLHKLRHSSNLDKSMLQLYKHLPWIAGEPVAKVLENIDCGWRKADLQQLIADSARMSADNQDHQRRLKLCTSFQAVERLHDQLVDAMNIRHARARTALTDHKGNLKPFPKEPAPGNKWVKPITTPEALAEEGRAMRHCVKAYTSRVQEGEYYVYHMDHPEPVTIGIKLRNGKISGLDQAYGFRNARPSKEAQKVMMDWFKKVLGQR